MTYKTRQEVDAAIAELEKIREGLPEGRGVSEGWEFRRQRSAIHLMRTWCDEDSQALIVAMINSDGFHVRPVMVFTSGRTCLVTSTASPTTPRVVSKWSGM